MAFEPRKNVSLASLTTLRVGGLAAFFSAIGEEQELSGAFEFAKKEGKRVLVLGGGSNVLVPDEGVSGLVLKVELSGIEFKDDGASVLVTAGAGVSFDELVAATVGRGLWGLENLSSIPGTVGATPVQNVGAYGVEVSELITSVRAYDTETGEFVALPPSVCEFGYRYSRFKREPERFVVTAVTYTLSKEPKRRLVYKDLDAWFADAAEPALSDVREAVQQIRAKKFPDLREIGTAGSFFKNPIVSAQSAQELRNKYPDIPLFPLQNGSVKVALGWILEHVLKVKGVREGNVGTFSGQALVLVSYDGATAHEVDAFARKIVDDVREHAKLDIEREVVTFGK